jgi:hypothetical protein
VRTPSDPAYVEAAMAATAVGAPEILEPVLASASSATIWTRAIRAILAGRLAEAARECASAHERHYAAILTLRAVEQGEALEPAQKSEAVEFFRSVGATRDLARIEPEADPVLIDTG